jgi:Ca2+-binding EF-hand superfamily protein
MEGKSTGNQSGNTKRGEKSTSKSRMNEKGEKSGSPMRESSRRSRSDSAPPPIIKTKSDKSLNKSEKKRKKSRSHDMSKKRDEKKKHSRTKHRSLYEKLMLSCGFYVGHVQLKDPRAIEAAQALDLKQWHLRRMKAKFDQIDIDGSGNIDFDEFFEAIGELRSPFTDKLFALIDVDKSGTIEFDEFVRVLATYCMFSKDEILRFCFECFDVDRSGTIDEKEFVELCK